MQFGDFELPSTFLDFGLKLRTLANEYTALTSPDRFWSDAQKVLYGRCAPPFEFVSFFFSKMRSSSIFFPYLVLSTHTN